MRDVTMPNGDVVSFPDDMPAARIQSLIASKFPNEVQGLLEKSGKADNAWSALGKSIVGAPGNIAIGAQGVAQMVAEGEAGDPNSFASRLGPDFTLSARPGLDEANFLQWGRKQLGLDTSTPLTEEQRAQIEALGKDAKSRDAFRGYVRSGDALGTTPQRVAAEAFKGERAREAIGTIIPEVQAVPGSTAAFVGTVGGSIAQMLPGYVAFILTRNPAPAVALAQTLTSGQSYVDARAAGVAPGKAAEYAMMNGFAEAVGEALPLGMILKEGGGKLLPRLFKAGASEALQEGVTQFIQSMLQSGTVSPDMTWGQVKDQVVTAMAVGMTSGVLLGGGVALMDKLQKAAPSAEDISRDVFPPPPADKAPAVPSLPPPAEQLALPSPEAYATPDIVRRQPAAPEPLVEPVPVPSEIEQQAKDALKRSRQAETAALLQTARETVSPIGAFEATELPADVAIKVNTSRARRGRSIDTPITVEDMVRAKVPQEQIDAAIALRKPLTAGRQLTPRDVRTAARAKNIRLDSNFDELARRATGATNVEGMSQTQLSVLHDVISGLPAHDAPVSIPIADQNPFTETQYDKAVSAVRKQGRYTLAAIKEGSGLKSDADARAVRAAMVRRGQLVQRGKDDYRLYDNLGAQTKPTPADLPNAAFVEHVIRKMPVGAVTVQQNGRSKGKFASEAEASDAVRKIRNEEAKGGVTGPARAKIEIRPAGSVAYGVIENRYDEQGNFLGQATVDTYDNEAAARTAADKLNAPDRATPRPETAAAQAAAAGARPPGNFVILKDGKPLAGFNTAAEVREELRRLRDENRQLGLKEPDLAIERAPGVAEAAPAVPASPKAARKPPAPATIAGRVADVMARLSAIGNTRGLPLLGTKVSLTDVVAGRTGTPVEGTFSPSKNLIRLSLHHLKPGMTTEEIVDTLAGVMDHETIHALKTAGVLDPSSEAWKTLVNYAKKATNKKLSAERKKQLAENRLSESFFDVARLLYTGRPGYESPQDIEEEAIAEVFRHWAADRRSVVGKPATALRQIVEWFKRLIRAVPEDLLRSIESGELVRQFKAPGSDTPRARTAEEMAQAKTGMAAAQATGDKPRAQENVRRYVRARDQAREDRYGRAGAKTVIGDTPSQAYATGEAPDPLEAENVLRRYGEVSGQPAPPLRVYLPEPMAFLQKLAAAQEKAKHSPKADAVAKAYRALTAETRTMFDALGVKVEVFTGPGEPYTSQRAMFEDIVQNKQVKLRLSTAQFGLSPDNAGHPMYAASGVTATDGTALTHNDLFRVVHEVYGHAPNGLRYQPRDAYNAYHAHRLLYSKDAIPALLTETLAQSAWQNYGAHMLRSDGTVPQTFDADYLPLDQRQYAEQKAYVLPEMVFEDPGVQAAAEAEQAEELRLSVGQDNEPTVIRLADVRERKQLETMHGRLMRDVRTRAGEISAATRAAVDAGVFDGVEIGDRLSSRNVKGDPLPPMKVEGRFLREWTGRSQAAAFERAGKKPTLVEFNGTQYVPMLRVLQGEGPPANATPQQQEEWDAAHPNAEWSRFDVPLDLVRDRRMGGLRAVRPVGDERYSVNSTEFQSWFGQSAVSQNGVPLRVYHATSRASFDEFDTHRSELGTHFGTIAQAGTIARSKMLDEKTDQARGRGHDVGVHVYPVYLSIQRPLRLRDEGTFNNGTIADQLADLGLISTEDAAALRAYGYQNRRALQDVIKAHGYDGIVYMNRLEGSPAGAVAPTDKELHGLSDRMYRKKYPFAADSWIIFEPTQAKSAIANRGTYDPNNPDMRESIGNERFEAYAQRADDELSPMERSALPGIERGLVGPIPAAVLAAREYAKAAGLPIRRQSSYVRVDVPRAKRIAQAYADMPHAPQDPAVRAAYQAMIEETIETEPPLREEDWDEKYSVTSPLFDETYGARLPGGRLYGNNDIDPATALSPPGVSPVPLSMPVDGGEFFGGRLAEAQLRMAQDGIDGASMVYMRTEDFLRLAGDAIHPRQEVFNAAVADGMKFNGLPSIWFDGNDGVVNVLAVDGAYAARAIAGRADRVPVIIQRKGNQYFGSLVGFETPNGTTAMPNGGLREFYPERRGERMSVGSEAFSKWFGDSKVVDTAFVTSSRSTGPARPLIVYHGTPGPEFTIFDPRRKGTTSFIGIPVETQRHGFFFAEDRAFAQSFADQGRYSNGRLPRTGSVLAVYLSIKNPLYAMPEGLRPDDIERLAAEGVDRRWLEDYAGDPRTMWENFDEENGEFFVSALRRAGYDGVYMQEIDPDATDADGTRNVWVAFDNTQIKSAIGNRGTWSAANPDIRESLNSPIGTRVPPQIDPDTYSVLHRDNLSWLGRQMVRLGRGDIGKADVPVIGETKLFRGLFGGSSLYEMRIANEDQYLSLFEMMERIRKEGGKITDEQNAYIAQQAAGSKATYRIQEHQRDIYDPLLAAIKAAHKAKKFTLKDYEKFLYARHAPERNAFLRARGSKEPNPSGMSEAEAAAIIDQFTKSGQLKDMLALDPLLARLRRSITDTRVSGGLLAPDAVSTVYEHWVPMQNGEDFDPFDTISRRSTFTGRGMSVAGRESRPVVGRGSKAGDLLSNMILQDTLAVVRSEHAAFNRKLVETIAANPALAQQDIEILSKPPLKTVVGSDGRIRTIVDPNFRSADNIYVTKIAGREVVMRVNNPWVSRALKGDFVHQTGPIVQSIGTVTRVLAAMRTTYNPTFVVTNLARDLQAAALNLTPQDIKGLSARMLAGVPRAGKAIGAYLISKDTSTEYGRYYEEMLTNGWTVSHMGLQTLETVVDRVRADAHSATGWRLTASQATKATRNIFGAIEATLSVAENGVRLSAYVEARRAGASIAQAGYLAKNLTVNFNKRGERSGAMNMLYMFYNAGVQGGAVLANMAKSKRGWKYLGAIVTTGFVLDMVNRMLSDDDNEDGVADYDQFSEYELSHNLIVPNPLAIMGVAGQPKYLKFPMPLGYNAAHNLGRNISNMFARKNKTWVDSLASIASGTADALNPIASGGNFLNFFAPTFADPFVDMAANTDYAGRAIIPERPGYGGVETPQSQLYWSSTDKSFVDIAAFLNSLTGGNEVRKGAIDWSPEALDYWTAFAAGGVGRFLLDMKYNITEGAPLLLAGKFDEIDTTRLPLINVVVGSNVDRAASSLYYEVNKEALTVEEEVKRFVEIGDPARARAARAARPVEYAMSKMFAGTDKQISSLRKQIRKVEEGRATDELKAKQIKRLRDQIDELMARALKAYYRAKDAVK